MAKYKKGKDAKYVESVDEEGDERDKKNGSLKEIDLPVHESLFEISERPFSAINPLLLPDDSETAQAIFDEFGFRIDNESKILHSSPVETSQNRMRWIAHIEFAHDDIDGELFWSKVDVNRLDSDKTMEMVREIGIVHSLRPFLWPRFSGAIKKREASSFSYEDVLKRYDQDQPSISAQIEKDLLRTLPNNICFWHKKSKGINSLRRVLRAVAYIYPDIGYCQGMGIIVASLLLFCCEETTFWIMASLIEDIFPANYYSRSLLGLQADEKVVRQLMTIHLPELDKLLQENDVEMSLLSVNWLLTAFASVFPMRVLLRVWDYLFLSGGITIFRIFISMLKINEDEILELKSEENISAELFNALAQMPSSIIDPDHLIQVCISFEFSITNELVDSARRHQQAVLLANQGMLVNPNKDTNLPKQRVQRREFKRSKSIVQKLFVAKEHDDEKLKNIRQTELIVDLRDAVLNICRYFIECDSSLENKITFQADYSVKGSLNDEEEFLKSKRQGYRRARALLDFQRQDEDELGFRKNDIITVICEKDEHCWVGEINSLRGWFPAKFVEVVDDRGKNYMIYGDEAVHPEITEKIRGQLCSALSAILNHGLRKSGVLNFAHHPWLFIEEIAQDHVRNRFKAVHSRLTLCSTFKLDEDGKVLAPDELLFRGIELINESHNSANAQMDVKLRSLVALGVTEQCLHLWFDLLCSCPSQDPIRNKYYNSNSFLRSPAWKQIKCELRLLTQFSFNLRFDYELAETTNKKYSLSNKNKTKGNSTICKTSRDSDGRPLKESVRDMLMKHHLFSWDL